MKVVVQYFCNIISLLNSNKASGSNSIPYRILFLLKNENFEAIGRFIQPLFHDWCFSFCTQNCKSSFEKIFKKLMYKRFYTFLNRNNVNNLQFGFRQQYSTSHALINITENIRKALDDGNIGCGVFAGLQKAFIL